MMINRLILPNTSLDSLVLSPSRCGKSCEKPYIRIHISLPFQSPPSKTIRRLICHHALSHKGNNGLGGIGKAWDWVKLYDKFARSDWPPREVLGTDTCKAPCNTF